MPLLTRGKIHPASLKNEGSGSVGIWGGTGDTLVPRGTPLSFPTLNRLQKDELKVGISGVCSVNIFSWTFFYLFPRKTSEHASTYLYLCFIPVVCSPATQCD